VLGAESLVGQMLLGEVLADALQALDKRCRLCGADVGIPHKRAGAVCGVRVGSEGTRWAGADPRRGALAIGR